MYTTIQLQLLPKNQLFQAKSWRILSSLHHQWLWRFEFGTEHSYGEAKHYQSITSRTSPTPSKHTSFSCKPHHIIVLTSFPFRIKVIIIQINVVQHSAVQIPFYFIFLKHLKWPSLFLFSSLFLQNQGDNKKPSTNGPMDPNNHLNQQR